MSEHRATEYTLVEHMYVHFAYAHLIVCNFGNLPAKLNKRNSFSVSIKANNKS